MKKTPSGGGVVVVVVVHGLTRRVWVAVVRSGANNDGRGGSGELVGTTAAGGKRAAGVFRRYTRTHIYNNGGVHNITRTQRVE